MIEHYSRIASDGCVDDLAMNVCRMAAMQRQPAERVDRVAGRGCSGLQGRDSLPVILGARP